MKIRTGFVSNSSSSSYVIIAAEDTVEKVLSAMTEEEKKVLEAGVEFKSFTIRGVPMRMIAYGSGNNYEGAYEPPKGHTEDELYEIRSQFIEDLKMDKETVRQCSSS